MKAKRERVSSFAGKGCFVQALGILAPFVLGAVFGAVGIAIGILLLLWLFFLGSSMSMTWRCGHCRNPLASKSVRICPTCTADLE